MKRLLDLLTRRRFTLADVSITQVRADEISLERQETAVAAEIEDCHRQIEEVVKHLVDGGKKSAVPAARRRIRMLERRIAQKQRTLTRVSKALEALSGIRQAVEHRDMVQSKVLSTLSAMPHSAVNAEVSESLAMEEESWKSLGALSDIVSPLSEVDAMPMKDEDAELERILSQAIDAKDPDLAVGTINEKLDADHPGSYDAAGGI